MKKIFVLLLASLMFLVSCKGNPSVKLPEPTSDLVEFSLSSDEFLNPLSANRPLWGHYTMSNANLLKSKEWGYGGMATEVSWNNYMQDAEALESFADSVAYAKEQNLFVWIIDEYGWPSGKAGGLVLDEDPTLEAKGLVCLQDTTSGETVEFTLPYGHEAVVSAYAIRKSDRKIINLISSVKANGELSFTPTDGTYDVYYIVKKRYYEQTHAMQNWVQKARYPDLMRKESTELFIKHTHEKYYEYLSEYFGNTVEAFFTEEPQLIGYYMADAPDYARPVIKDPTDPKIPLLPSINFSEKFFREFENRRGYSLENKLHYLFGGTSEEALKVRSDYHQTTSDLFRDNYNKVIADWCDEKNIAYSGHFLFEEYTVHHAMWIGNIIQQCALQQIPSVDMLWTNPRNVAETGKTALKYGQSAADFTGAEHQAGEYNASFDGAGNFTLEQMKANAGLHAVYGYDKFCSFYQNADGNLSKELIKEFNTYSGRLSSFLQGGKHNAGVAVYYPEEAIFANTLPSAEIFGGWLESMDYGVHSEKINNSVNVITSALAKTQTDYSFLDRTFLKQCTIKDGVITTPKGMKYTTFILPYINILDKDVIGLIEKMNAEGVTVIADNGCTVFAEDKARFEAIKRTTFTTENSLKDIIYTLGVQTVEFKKNFLNARVLRQDYSNAYTFMLCNMENNIYNGDINLKVTGKSVFLYDPEDGSITPLSASTDVNGNIVVNTRLGALETKMFVVYK